MIQAPIRAGRPQPVARRTVPRVVTRSRHTRLRVEQPERERDEHQKQRPPPERRARLRHSATQAPSKGSVNTSDAVRSPRGTRKHRGHGRPSSVRYPGGVSTSSERLSRPLTPPRFARADCAGPVAHARALRCGRLQRDRHRTRDGGDRLGSRGRSLQRRGGDVREARPPAPGARAPRRRRSWRLRDLGLPDGARVPRARAVRRHVPPDRRRGPDRVRPSRARRRGHRDEPRTAQLLGARPHGPRHATAPPGPGVAPRAPRGRSQELVSALEQGLETTGGAILVLDDAARLAHAGGPAAICWRRTSAIASAFPIG